MFRSALRAPCFNSEKSLGQALGEFVVLAVAPDVFGGIQLRNISRQVLGVDPALLRGHELLHHPAAMRRESVPHQQQLSGDVPQQMFEKRYDLWRANRSGIEPEVEIPQRYARDDQKRLPVEVILQRRCVAPPGPRPAAVRPLAAAAECHQNLPHVASTKR